MRRIRSFLKDERGSFVTWIGVFFCLMAFALLIFEYQRVIDVRSEAEDLIQRGINVALEDMVRDTLRWDYSSTLETTDVWPVFDRYLRIDSGLRLVAPLTYRKEAADGANAWQIEVSWQNSSANPAVFEVHGNIRTRTMLNLLSGDVLMPFSLRSRTVRLDE